MPIVLQQLAKEKYHIVIITNQAGIGTGKVKADDIKKKIHDIRKVCGVPMSALIATEDDKYRKPLTDSWFFLIK